MSQRVGAAAAAAEILVSEETLEAAVGHALSDSREYDLKGLASADSSHSTGADHGSIALIARTYNSRTPNDTGRRNL